jgi:hypothetical protein
MVNVSRRKLAAYAADELLAGQSLNEVAKKLAAVLIASKRQKQIEQLLQDVAWELENRHSRIYRRYFNGQDRL